LQPAAVPAGVRPTALHLVGNYAMQLAWSDGHDTGIYSWDALRALCPCPQCSGAARRDHAE
jgi:DUF971 family protein